jgi:hypothetical protein
MKEGRGIEALALPICLYSPECVEGEFSEDEMRRPTVARKLSGLLHSLWVTAEVYDPFYNAHRRQSKEAA